MGRDVTVLIERAEALLGRLEKLLPAPVMPVDWKASIAFRWRKVNGAGQLQAVRQVHRIQLKDLRGIDEQKSLIEQNTRQFVEGHPANNVLLTGARGTGKSSLIKALLTKYAPRGLRVAWSPDFGYQRVDPEVAALTKAALSRLDAIASGIDTVDSVCADPFRIYMSQAALRLRQTPRAARRIAIVLANYPNRDSRLANGVGLDTPAAVIEVLREAALIEVRLVTGKRNQIRIQAALRGHPLVGERQYLGPHPPKTPISFERQALHAWRGLQRNTDDAQSAFFAPDCRHPAATIGHVQHRRRISIAQLHDGHTTRIRRVPGQHLRDNSMRGHARHQHQQ